MKLTLSWLKEHLDTDNGIWSLLSELPSQLDKVPINVRVVVVE